ncbi:GNAT family N-acetyltransferase [Noviherbaspirillum galbum]|uniref:GNAT family N-acetyltransferase n=1 Tax=Noviherbaspirillum galbum TaxID=2709383 RepID=A0A6B3STD4_9BURK|nr:GNAT family N-acetyltransferase [Noviherbaspirillum galbum]NEX64033.1 GNAT family N-acetyltransferase [Noviherbaspirillum galbum]
MEQTAYSRQDQGVRDAMENMARQGCLADPAQERAADAVRPLAQPRLAWLSLDDPDDRRRYAALWKASAARRPQDAPEYLDLVQPRHYRQVAVHYTHPGGTVLYPFFECEVRDLPGFAGAPAGMRHIVSPYGYGGPLHEGDPARKAAVSRDFEAALNAELRRRGCVTEFVREDLFSGRLADRTDGELVDHQPNVVVRLRRDPESIWNGYKNTARRNIRQAQRAGLRVSFDHRGSGLGGFLDVYYETMRRRDASDFFFIPAERFEALTAALCPLGNVAYVYVHDGDTVVASDLLLICGDALYAFLSASRASAFQKRPNDLMRHESIMWGHAHGYRHYVLGGGVSPSDGIYRFKLAFDAGGLVPFRTRHVIHDAAACERLVSIRRMAEAERGRPDWQPRPGFFPDYLA